MDVRRRLAAAGNIQVAAARRTAADEDRVVALRQQRLHRIDALAAAEFDAQVEDVADFLVDDLLGQAEARHLGAHEAAGLAIGLEHGDLVAQRRQIARDGQRSRPGTDAGDALAVAAASRLRHARADRLAPCSPRPRA